MVTRQFNGNPYRRLFLAALLGFSWWSLAANATELQSATFAPNMQLLSPNASAAELAKAKIEPWFGYSVSCDGADRCRMKFSMGADSMVAKLERSEPLRKNIETTLRRVKERGYPAKNDKEYLPLDGLAVTDCWSAGDPSGAGGLCRFQSPTDQVTWVVLWGDMCSASCYSGFVPFYVVAE